MEQITVTMTIKEAMDASMLLSKADPLGVFTGALLRRVDMVARDAMAKVKPEARPGQA